MPKRSREESPSFSAFTSGSPETGTSLRETVDTNERSPKYIQTAGRPLSHIMKCSLPPHKDVLSFTSLEEFEVHYAKAHANRCAECRHNFPTERFLSLHITENHDPLSEARKARGEKTYQCFVEDCDKVCSTPHKRRMHLTDKHMFPKNYDFAIVNTGVDKRSSMLRTRDRKNSSAQPGNRRAKPRGDLDTNESQETSEESPAFSTKLDETINAARSKKGDSDGIERITSSMSSLNFVPPSIRFGRGGRRGGFSRS